ncbi:MAG: thermonuclease family protein [Candidatus Sericytochromatia bacterium]|nr:thermonuclease family protein [Candidatus Sericytochromatia bacterium]
MKVERRLLPLLLSLIGFLGASPAEALVIEGRVVRVSDGDTVAVAAKNGVEKIRLLGIDCPEKAQAPWGPRAKAFTQGRVAGKTVRIETDVQERDKYGRLLGYLFVGNELVNESLVREGLAMLYTAPPNVRFSERLLAAQRGARGSGKGIWSKRDGLKQSPYEFRHGGRAAPASVGQPALGGGVPAASVPDAGLRRTHAETPVDTPFVANTRTGKLHKAACRWARRIAVGSRKGFASAAAGEAEGFKPCGTCLR